MNGADDRSAQRAYAAFAAEALEVVSVPALGYKRVAGSFEVPIASAATSDNITAILKLVESDMNGVTDTEAVCGTDS